MIKRDFQALQFLRPVQPLNRDGLFQRGPTGKPFLAGDDVQKIGVLQLGPVGPGRAHAQPFQRTGRTGFIGFAQLLGRAAQFIQGIRHRFLPISPAGSLSWARKSRR